MDSLRKRISALKAKVRRKASMANLLNSNGSKAAEENQDLAGLLRQSRQISGQDNRQQTLITDAMLKDPENGWFWKQMQAGRKRVRRAVTRR
ncbi:MAG: hypothetical protein ACP5IL_07705 [Syntrophobacteraceae bacterium]